MIIDYLAYAGCYERRCKASFKVSQNTMSLETRVTVEHHDPVYLDRYWLHYTLPVVSVEVADIHARITDWLDALHMCPPQTEKSEERVW